MTFSSHIAQPSPFNSNCHSCLDSDVSNSRVVAAHYTNCRHILYVHESLPAAHVPIYTGVDDRNNYQ